MTIVLPCSATGICRQSTEADFLPDPAVLAMNYELSTLHARDSSGEPNRFSLGFEHAR
jgi:hypothetical protein